jgi:DNA-binding NarL/FixJ family response regulator
VSVRVVIADDQQLVRHGFRLILDAERDIDVVGEAPDGVEAVEAARRLRPDVVLMDVRMPRMDGVQATARLTAPGFPGRARVLMLTTFDGDEHLYPSLRAGASGFLLKDAPPDELVWAVRVIAAGDALLAPSVTRRLIDDLARRPTLAETSTHLADLTGREREVLGLIARGQSNSEIARTLAIGETTVKTHVGRILTKLGLRDRAQAVIVAYESGLVRPGEAASPAAAAESGRPAPHT